MHVHSGTHVFLENHLRVNCRSYVTTSLNTWLVTPKIRRRVTRLNKAILTLIKFNMDTILYVIYILYSNFPSRPSKYWPFSCILFPSLPPSPRFSYIYIFNPGFNLGWYTSFSYLSQAPLIEIPQFRSFVFLFSLVTVTFLKSAGAVLQNAPQFGFKLKFWGKCCVPSWCIISEGQLVPYWWFKFDSWLEWWSPQSPL